MPWMQHIWQQPYDKNGEKAAQGKILPDLLANLLDHPYFSRPYPKSTGRELFSLSWLQGRLKGNEKPEDVIRTLVFYTAQTIFDANQTSCSGDSSSLYLRRWHSQSGFDARLGNPVFSQHQIAQHSQAPS